MTQISTIPYKIPKKILKNLKNNEYDEIILFALGVFGSHKLKELINNPSEGIENRLDEHLFNKTAAKLINEGLIEQYLKDNEIHYRIITKGEDKLMERVENSRIVNRLIKTFTPIIGPIEKRDNLKSQSISSFTLSYKDIVFGLLSIHWRMNTFYEVAREYEALGPDKNVSLGRCIENNAVKYANNPAIKYEDIDYTYKEMNETINRYANYFLSLGIKKVEVVNVMLENRPEILFVIGAMSKIGAIASLINTRQRAVTLTHSLKLNEVRFFIIGEELLEAFEEVKVDLELKDKDILFYMKDTGKMEAPEGYLDLIEIVSNQDTSNPPTTAEIKGKDTYAYIFTSGTTGFPKAAHIRNIHTASSIISWGKLVFHIDPDDVMYICLPLYHSNAIHIGWAAALSGGAAVAIGRRFSVRNFWKDCIRYSATCFNYIGEVCRYLFNQPPSPIDRQHNIYKIGGNGLRPEIWKEFKERFGIKEVYEHYGMTEMMGMFCNYLNIDGTIGANYDPYAIVKYDIDNDEPISNEDGILQRVDEGEAGLLLMKMRSQYIFAGYSNNQSNKNKVIFDVFEKGDAWYNTGDMLRSIGYYHAQFVDRLGDTFRWKGENVSTTEVDDVITIFDQVEVSSVYGVQIPGTEGRAGMVSVLAKKSHEDFDFKNFLQLLQKNLPKYAIPKFIRFLSDLSTTSTHKIQKSLMKKESFDITQTNDPIYVLLPNGLEYVRLTNVIYDDIISKKYKF